MAEEKVEEKKTINTTVETYALDMAQAIESNENGVARKVIEEEERKAFEKQNSSLGSNKNKFFLFTGMLLVVLAFGSVSAVYLFRKEIFTVTVVPQYVPIIFTDKTAFKDVTGLKKDKIIQTFVNEVNIAEYKNGGVEGIYFTADQKVLGLRGILSLIEANIDQTKIGSINDNFLMGAVNNGKRNVFILLKINSIADIFEPMREWESKMFFDLHGFFGVDLNANTKYLLEKNFEDGFVQNKNARILYDKDGRIVMMYVFAEDDSLIFGDSEKAVSEIMLRLSSSTIKK